MTINKKKLLILGLVLVLVGGGTYYFVKIRPADLAKKSVAELAEVEAKDLKTSKKLAEVGIASSGTYDFTKPEDVERAKKDSEITQAYIDEIPDEQTLLNKN